jgi:hypothetical protein
MAVFRAVRRFLNAAGPLIEEQARRDERADLDAAGRLLPEGCEHQSRVQLLLRWTFGDGRVDEWGPATLGHAQELLAEGLGDAVGELLQREHWAGPWTVVEPVEVPDAVV